MFGSIKGLCVLLTENLSLDWGWQVLAFVLVTVPREILHRTSVQKPQMCPEVMTGDGGGSLLMKEAFHACILRS